MFFSVLLTLISIEIVYRLYLNFKINESQKAELPESELNYWAFDEPVTEYDREFGYSYVPNRSFVMVRVLKGYPVMCNEITINKLGNTNRNNGGFAEADLNILVFGDSFTANIHHNGHTWPDLLQDKLEAGLSRKVNIVNFGRSGYGVLQMFDLVNAKVKEFKPDLVIVAFITNDLTRARFWRAVSYVNGEKQWLASSKPQVNLKTSVPVAVLNPLMTKEWCESRLASYEKDDPLLRDLNEQFRRLKQKHLSAVTFTSFSTSFLFDRIIYGDPFYDFTEPSIIPRLTIDSFDMDAKFTQNVTSLNQSNIPYLIVHIPKHQELRAKRYILNDQQEALLQSLRELTDKEVISLLDDDAISIDDDGLDNLFLLPYDVHPSLQGLEFIAENVGRVLINGQTVNNE